MKLIGFQVTKYRNIIDSGWVDVSDIASIVGQNECGKSNLLKALAKLNAFDGEKYEIAEDWPIDLWAERDLDTVVCTVKFDLTPDDIEALRTAAEPPQIVVEGDEQPRAAQPDWPKDLQLVVTRDYQNKRTFVFDPILPAGHTSSEASAWAERSLPKCVYMDDYTTFSGSHPNLPDLYQRKTQRQKLKAEEETILITLELAAMDVADLVQKQSSAQTQRAYDTNAASRHLSKQFKNLWNQKSVKFDIRVDGTHLNIFVEDDGLDAFVPMEARSRGFQWYVSFVWRFTHASKGQFRDCILLLDEPGVHLHHAGHQDLLRYLQTLSESNTVIYTTHLATMLDLAHPERVRIVEVHDHHAQIIKSMVSTQSTPMMVIEAALGLSGAMSGLLGNRQNLIVEGGQDAVVLYKLSGVLRSSGEAGLSDRIYLLPARGAPNTPMYAGFMVGNGWDAGVLLDSDDAGNDAKKKISQLYLSGVSAATGSKFRVLMLKDAAGILQNEAAIEDLFPAAFYLECVNAAFGTNLQEADLPADGSDQVCKRAEAALKGRGRISDALDKTIVMNEMQKRFDSMNTKADLPAGTAAKARKLIDRINAAFG